MTEPLSIEWLKRVFKKVVVTESGCWEWQGYVAPCGYARMQIKKVNLYIHRLFYVTYKEPIVGKLVCHTCDNKRCLNPDHMFLGTHNENMRDMKVKGRSSGPKSKGVPNIQTRLTAEQVAEIYTSKKKVRALAEDYNVAIKTVYFIKRDISWTAVTSGLEKGINHATN